MNQPYIAAKAKDRLFSSLLTFFPWRLGSGTTFSVSKTGDMNMFSPGVAIFIRVSILSRLFYVFSYRGLPEPSAIMNSVCESWQKPKPIPRQPRSQGPFSTSRKFTTRIWRKLCSLQSCNYMYKCVINPLLPATLVANGIECWNFRVINDVRRCRLSEVMMKKVKAKEEMMKQVNSTTNQIIEYTAWWLVTPVNESLSINTVGWSHATFSVGQSYKITMSNSFSRPSHVWWLSYP